MTTQLVRSEKESNLTDFYIHKWPIIRKVWSGHPDPKKPQDLLAHNCINLRHLEVSRRAYHGVRMSGPIRTAIISLATCSPLRTPASYCWATISVSPQS